MLLQEMVRQALKPNVVSCSAAVSACERGKQWEGALMLMKEMVHHVLTLDVVSYSAAIIACERGKQ